MHETVREGNIERVRALLSAGAKVNEKEQSYMGNTPVYLATCTGNKEVLKLLIDSGADVNTRNNLGQTALDNALLQEYDLEVIKILTNAGAHVQPDFGRSAMHYLTQKNNPKLIEFLLSQGVDVNAPDDRNRTPLHTAAIYNKAESHRASVEMLLKNGAEVDTRCQSGETALYFLVKKADVGMVRLLIDGGADVNAQDDHQETLLFEAVRTENTSLVQLIIDHCSDVNSANFRGSTPLHWAYKYGGKKVIKCLLDNGAVLTEIDPTHVVQANQQIYSMFFHKTTSEATLRFLFKYFDVNTMREVRVRDILTSRLSQPASWNLILEHLAKLLVLEIPVSQEILGIASADKFREYFDRCKKELGVAKNTKLKSSWITYFNLLVDGKRKLKNYAGNEDLVNNFEKSECIKMFPIYGAQMQQKVAKGIERREIFDKSSILLSCNLPIFSPSHLIVRDVLDCVTSRKDLLKFCEKK